MYTREQWEKDRAFSAKPGEEITEDIYNEMYNCMPPLRLPKETALKALEEYKVPVHAGFLMGEPHTSSKEGLLYLAFGMNNYGGSKPPRYFYLGLSLPAKKTLDGLYYEFDCMNAFVEGKLFPAEEWTEEEAIAKAADYEATLYLHEIRNGETVNTRTLYDPFTIYGTGEPEEDPAQDPADSFQEIRKEGR